MERVPYKYSSCYNSLALYICCGVSSSMSCHKWVHLRIWPLLNAFTLKSKWADQISTASFVEKHSKVMHVHVYCADVSKPKGNCIDFSTFMFMWALTSWVSLCVYNNVQGVESACRLYDRLIWSCYPITIARNSQGKTIPTFQKAV